MGSGFGLCFDFNSAFVFVFVRVFNLTTTVGGEKKTVRSGLNMMAPLLEHGRNQRVMVYLVASKRNTPPPSRPTAATTVSSLLKFISTTIGGCALSVPVAAFHKPTSVVCC